MKALAVLALAASCGVWVWTWTPPAPARPRPRPKPVLTVPVLGAPVLGALLPVGAEHGLAMRLHQYPDVRLATGTQRAAARRLLERLRTLAASWRDPKAARAAGFDLRRPRRRPGETRVMWFHSENRVWHRDRHYLDPERPDTLIFADVPHRPLIVVGVMISMPRGLRGPTPGGPITRWHSHVVCVQGMKRGLKPLADGSCPAGARLAQGSEMMHVWFTHDLRSAFAIHAPGPELCAQHVLPASVCRDPHAFHVM